MARKSFLWVLLLLILLAAAVGAYFGKRYYVGSETPPAPKPQIHIEFPSINDPERSDTVDKKGPKGLADYCRELGDRKLSDPACKLD